MHDTVLCYCDTPVWRGWGDLLYSVETDKIGYEHVLGLSLFDYNQQHLLELSLSFTLR